MMVENLKTHEVSDEIEKYVEASRKFNKVFELVWKTKDYTDKNGWNISFESYMTKWIPVEQTIKLSKRRGKMFPQTLTLSKVKNNFILKVSDWWPEKVFNNVSEKMVNEALHKFENAAMESTRIQWEAWSKVNEENLKKREEEDLQNLLDNMW